jgi:Ca2+-binding RTX toxin-like protein
MALPVIQHLVGGENASPISDLQLALAGTEAPGTATTWTFANASGLKVVLLGTFNVVNGFVQGGTVTGFDLYDGAVKVMTGSGYAISYNAILKAHDAAIADNYTVFYPTFFSEVRSLGSPDSDRMYGATEAGKFLGMAGDDFLYGDTGNEVMKGGLGNDWVEGRGAADKLFGNEGADIFAFTNADVNNDPSAVFGVHRIKDFDPKEDTIFLDVGRFAAIDAGPLDTSEYGVGRKAGSADEHFVFWKKTGDLYYDEDGTGKAKKVLIAEFDPGLKLKAHHFDADFVS